MSTLQIGLRLMCGVPVAFAEGGGGHGGQGMCGIFRSHCPGAGSETQNVTPGFDGQGCGTVVHGSLIESLLLL
eukprot:COSAG02_NODE_63677_length_262_cov_1.251534_1_plen_72_part_01